MSFLKPPPILPEGDFVPPVDLARKDDPSVRYTRSYLLIRAVVGLLGVVLPFTFIVGEAFIDRGVRFRGSISAYYHSPMRDVFIGGLCVIGFLLIMYLSGGQGSDRRWDRWLSTLAGWALLLVVFFPTKRPGIEKGAQLCGDTPDPPPLCSAIQQRFHEEPVAAIHFTFAVIFILCLAVICFYWAARDVEKRENDAKAKGRNVSKRDLWLGRRAMVYIVCGILIVVGIVWVGLGVDIWKLTPLYVGEVISIWSFGVAWLFSSWGLWKELVPGVKEQPVPERPPLADELAVAEPGQDAAGETPSDVGNGRSH